MARDEVAGTLLWIYDDAIAACLDMKAPKKGHHVRKQTLAKNVIDAGQLGASVHACLGESC